MKSLKVGMAVLPSDLNFRHTFSLPSRGYLTAVLCPLSFASGISLSLPDFSIRNAVSWHAGVLTVSQIHKHVGVLGGMCALSNQRSILRVSVRSLTMHNSYFRSRGIFFFPSKHACNFCVQNYSDISWTEVQRSRWIFLGRSFGEKWPAVKPLREVPAVASLWQDQSLLDWSFIFKLISCLPGCISCVDIKV